MTSPAVKPEMPQNRLIREGESVFCRRCGSGRHAHRTGTRPHVFDGPPTMMERLVAWIRQVTA